MLDRQPANFARASGARLDLPTLAACAVALTFCTLLASQARAAQYEVWVHQFVDGQWVRQDERTLRTNDFPKAREYYRATRSGSEFWTATSNLPEEEWIGTSDVDKRALGEHLTSAKQALDDYKLPLAIDEATKAIGLNAASADGHLYLAHAHLLAGHPDQAIDAATGAIAIAVTDRTRDFGPHADKDAMSHWLRGQAHQLQGAFKQACQDYTQAIALKADLAKLALPKRAGAFFAGGEFQRAIADCNELLRVDPQDGRTYALRGQAFEQLDEVDRAIEDLTRSIQLLPDDAWGYTVRGDIRLRRKGQHAAAVKDFDEAIRRMPEEPLFYDIRGDALASFGEFDDAVEDYTRAIELNPQAAAFYHKRAVAWSGAGNYARALADLEEFLKRQPDSVQALANRGVLRKELGDLPGALADFEEALRREPAHFTALVERARISGQQGKFDVQSADLEKLLASAPRDAQANHYLAWLRATCPEAKYRNGQEAVKLATKACQLSNWSADNVATLAAACAEAGDFTSAVKWQHVALSDLRAGKLPTAGGERRLALYQQHKPYREYLPPLELAGRLTLSEVPKTPSRALDTSIATDTMIRTD